MSYKPTMADKRLLAVMFIIGLCFVLAVIAMMKTEAERVYNPPRVDTIHDSTVVDKDYPNWTREYVHLEYHGSWQVIHPKKNHHIQIIRDERETEQDYVHEGP